MNQPLSSSHFPYLPVHVQLITAQAVTFEFDLEPIVDTGFDDGLSVPRGLIPDSVPPISQSTVILADDTEVATAAYFSYVTIGQFDPIPAYVIVLGDEPLLGRDVTDHFKLIFDHGHTLTVEL